eukprot:CAMPEP_0204898974 /NCGR_PEP_ID=MMETSP1397-20131031/1584_1 /ASSEMBLY_ACC=CAM_ASM_000891 /TAXON_ID=49980 /ORGANISM="Climacostomum Climacostomum virens, Strain Stock W-24" /LENGTH=460 /DNA_ID=CAMNT_0052066877 /DNA_START=124 /DNA_END=1506 /DNA_ORIENTATION=-
MLGLLLGLALCEASIYVYSPDQLREEFLQKYHRNHIPSSLGNFGNPPYGSSILGRVFWPGADQELACGALSYIDFAGDPDPVNSPILLLKRGTCSFVQKVRHAQDIGASAVVIYNTNDDSVESIVMADDGTAGNLFIPAFLITLADGEAIIRYLKAEEFSRRVSLQLQFEMNHPGTYVEYTIWMSPDHWLVRSFLHEFAPSAKKFSQDEAIFTPHYVLWYCMECRRDNFTAGHDDCFSGGRYCAPDPDGAGKQTGQDVLYEDLRQLCIYSQYKESEVNKWWDYVYNLNSTCPDAAFTKDCSHKAMDQAGIDKDRIDSCVDSSFSGSDHAKAGNRLLAQEKATLLDAGIFFYPTISINNQTFRGDIEYDEVRSAICAGFKTRPKICYEWDGFDFEKDTDEDEGSEGISVMTLLLILSIGVALLVVGMFLVWKWIRSEMQKEMRREVSQYIALAERDSVGRD